MAEFKAGDRVVKMSGAAAGKYGTVNSVREDGTLNVTFDGERLPRYCDPMRCGQVARNGRYKVGDRVWVTQYGPREIYTVKESPPSDTGYYTLKGRYGEERVYSSWVNPEGYLPPSMRNSRAANAKFKVGDKVKVVGKNLASKGWVGKVIKVDTSNKGWPYKVSFDGREDGEYAEAEIVAANAEGAKFKVGDKVRHIDDAKDGPVGVVKGVYGDGRIKVKFPGLMKGGFDGFEEDELVMANAVRNERIRAYPDGPGEWILVDAVGDEGVGRTTATDERGIKAQLADIAVRTYRWHRPEIVIMREKYYSNAARNAVARNGDYDIEKFEVGKVYRAPWDRDWLAKVLSRTPSSIKVAIKSARDKTWHGADEQVTLRINPRKSEEQGAEVAKGWDWEFWADVKA